LRLLIDIAIGILIAAVLGLGSAWYAIERGDPFGGLTVGSWTAWPLSGSPDADPYSIARLARTSGFPLGAGEGIAFVAESDASGSSLTGRCAYTIAGQTPAARLWTLAAYDADGHLTVNSANHYGVDSREIVRLPDGSFEIAVSAVVNPGNWLPIAPVARFKLILRLYDTPVTIGGRAADIVMPRISRGRCG
jgi:hypothetical protein